MNTQPWWKYALAFLIDLFGSFIVIGYVIALLFGQTTSEGFGLTGGPAFLAIGLVVAYFIVMNKYFGGTLGKRILGLTKK